jgi:predicted nucleotidyltransferase
VVQSVPIENVAFVLDPVDALKQLRDMGTHVSPIQEATCDLAEKFVQRSGIEWENIGVTGSQLVGLELTHSDIDLVVFGETASRKLHSCLIASDSIPEFSSYHGELLEKHLQFRWSSHEKMLHELRRIESKKAFQGVFRKWEVFVRAVKYPSEIAWKYSDYTFRNEKERVIKGLVLDDSDSIFTPCYYTVQCEELPTLRYLISYRGRFTEHVRSGMQVEAKGRLESVRNTKTEDEYLQIVLGEKNTDYLVPI